MNGEEEMQDKKTRTEPKKERINLLYASPIENPLKKNK